MGQERPANTLTLVKTAKWPRSLFWILVIKMMKRVQRIALGVACELALCATLEAGTLASTNNVYASIVARNVFGLSPPPPQPSAPVQPPEPVDIITPTGIAAMSGQKWV